MARADIDAGRAPWRSSWFRWSVLLGFALGGFFDGILLHQILQWHHLLSLAPGMQDLRLQLLWDGYFHALMYLIAATALWGLWRARQSAEGAAGRAVMSALLLGFGLWHVVDAVLSHWILGIHRIRIDVANPLAWDWLWLSAFGLLPIFAARLTARSARSGPLGLDGKAMGLLLAAAAGMAAWSLAPAKGQAFTTVVFARAPSPEQLFGALAESRAELVWSDSEMTVLVVRSGRRWAFYRRGALLVGGAGLPAGCLAWARP